MRRAGIAIGAVLVAGLLGAGCSLPKAPCNLVIAAVDDPDLQQIPAGAEVLATAADVDPSGWAVREDETGQSVVDLQLKPEAAERFAAHTAANIGGYVAFAVDGVVVSTPAIMAPIDGGAVTISGAMDQDVVEAFGPCLPLELQPPT